MTIAGLNKFLVSSIVIVGVLLIFALACTTVLYINGIFSMMPLPPDSSFSLFGITISAYSNAAVTFAIIAIPAVTFILLGYIFFLFEKTHALEISFFGLFVFALSFEALRLYFPLYYINSFSLIFSSSVARTLFFFRFLAFLSLLTSSLFAHKNFTRDTFAIIFVLCFISFALTSSLPFNASRSVAYFLFAQRYRHLLYTFDGIICILSVFSYLFAGFSRSMPGYRKAAGGIAAALLGYTGLLYSGMWIVIIACTGLFLCGGLYFIRSVHQCYLWQ